MPYRQSPDLSGLNTKCREMPFCADKYGQIAIFVTAQYLGFIEDVYFQMA